MQRLLELARKADAAKSYPAVRSSIAQLQDQTARKNFYDRLRYPEPDPAFSLASVVEKALRAQTDRSVTICAIALKRYSILHGRPPAILEALVPELLPAVPVDYMDGQPLKYRLRPDGTFTLYSVGADAVDDGGDASLPPGKENLRSLWERKDFLWPSPATPDEVEAYRKEAAKN
jgi:hypothetical protein